MLLNAFSRSLDVGTQGFRGGIQHPFPTYSTSFSDLFNILFRPIQHPFPTYCDYLTTYKHPCILKDV